MEVHETLSLRQASSYSSGDVQARLQLKRCQRAWCLPYLFTQKYDILGKERRKKD